VANLPSTLKFLLPVKNVHARVGLCVIDFTAPFAGAPMSYAASTNTESMRGTPRDFGVRQRGGA
jgi:hypothetical protein